MNGVGRRVDCITFIEGSVITHEPLAAVPGFFRTGSGHEPERSGHLCN